MFNFKNLSYLIIFLLLFVFDYPAFGETAKERIRRQANTSALKTYEVSVFVYADTYCTSRKYGYDHMTAINIAFKDAGDYFYETVDILSKSGRRKLFNDMTASYGYKMVEEAKGMCSSLWQGD